MHSSKAPNSVRTLFVLLILEGRISNYFYCLYVLFICVNCIIKFAIFENLILPKDSIMKRIIFIVLAFCILTMPLMAQWEQLNGPGTSYGYGFVSQEDTIYISGLGSLYYSINKGTDWILVSNSIVDATNANLYLMHLVKKDSIFLGTAHGDKIYKSTDYGVTWYKASEGLDSYSDNVSGLAIFDNKVLASTYGKLFYSLDYGENWIQTSGYADDDPFLEFTEFQDSILAITDRGMIYISGDGINWIFRSDFNSNSQYCSITSNETIVFAIVDSSRVMKTVDMANNWTELILPQSDLSLTSIDCHEDQILIGTQYNGVLLSNDNGNSWEFINSGLTKWGSYVYFLNDGYLNVTQDGIFVYEQDRWHSRNDNQFIPECQQLVVENDTILTRADGYFMRYSTDGGDTWSSLNAGMEYDEEYEGEVRDFLRIGNSFFRVSRLDRISYLDSENGTWEPRNNGIECPEVHKIEYDGTNLFVLTNNCGMYKSSDMGLNWVSCCPEVPDELTNSSFCMDGLNSIIGFYGYTMYTNDGGDSWTTLDNLDWIIDAHIHGQVAIVVSYFYGCYVSYDNLHTWTQINTGLPLDSGSSYYDACQVWTDGENFFCGTEHNGIYVYLNGTWAPVNYGLSYAASISYIGEIDADSGYLYFTSAYYGIWKRQISEMISRPSSGYVYRDFENNGVQDETDMPLEDAIIHVVNSNGYYTSDEFGNYFAFNDYPIDTIKAYANCNYSVSNPEYYLVSEIQDSLDFAIYIKPDIHDLSSNITQYFPPVPGFDYWQMLTYANLGTESESGYVELNYDQNLILDQAFPVPDFINNYCLRWNFENLDLFQSSDIILKYFVPTSLELEQNLCFQTLVFPIDNDTTPLNNFDTLCPVVVGSIDPNIKEVNQSSIVSPEFIANQEELIYTIYFQNTGTAPAVNISILDTLSPNLFIPSFRVLSSSHNYDYSISGPGIVEFTFEDIMLPDSNTNELLSHGFIKYSVKPLRSLVIGDEINNTAHIYFDFNEAVVTNTTSNIVSIIQKVNTEKSGFTYSLYPNPVTEILNIETDCSGIKNIRIVDSQGRIVKTKNMHTTSLQLDCGDLLPGLYFVLISDESDYIRFKFVKQ